MGGGLKSAWLFALTAARRARPVARVAVAGGRNGAAWKVLLLGDRGRLAELEPQAARELADRLRCMADICEGKAW